MMARFKGWWSRRWFQNTVFVGLGAIGVYGFVYWDVVTRAHEAYRQGEKYMAWHQNPEEKKQALQTEFNKKKSDLDQQLLKHKISEDEHRRKLDAAAFDQQYNLEESSLKYAYQWYKDTYELFSPPESRWVKMAREKAPQVLELWKQELREQGVMFEDTMFE